MAKKTYIQSDEIYPSEYTEIHGNLFMAVPKDTLSPCTEQCHAKGFRGNKICSGYCFRWNNCEDIVFKRASEPQTDYVVKETLFGETCRLRQPIQK